MNEPQSPSIRRAAEMLGKKVRRQADRGSPIPLVGGVAIVAAVRIGGMCELQCPCCHLPAGIYSAMDLELARE